MATATRMTKRLILILFSNNFLFEKLFVSNFLFFQPRLHVAILRYLLPTESKRFKTTFGFGLSRKSIIQLAIF